MNAPVWRGPAPVPGTLKLCASCAQYQSKQQWLRRCGAVIWAAKPLPLEPNTYPVHGKEHCGCYLAPEPDPPLLAGVPPLEMIA